MFNSRIFLIAAAFIGCGSPPIERTIPLHEPTEAELESFVEELRSAEIDEEDIQFLLENPPPELHLADGDVRNAFPELGDARRIGACTIYPTAPLSTTIYYEPTRLRDHEVEVKSIRCGTEAGRNVSRCRLQTEIRHFVSDPRRNFAVDPQVEVETALRVAQLFYSGHIQPAPGFSPGPGYGFVMSMGLIGIKPDANGILFEVGVCACFGDYVVRESTCEEIPCLQVVEVGKGICI